MPDRDPQIKALLEVRTPPVTVEPRWDDVLRRAGGARRSVAHLPRRRWLVLAAVLAVPVGIAAAKAHEVFIHYRSGGVTGTPRQVIASVIRPFAGSRHIRADLSRARQLVTVSVGGHRHAYFMAPLNHGSGGCYFEIVNRVHVAEWDCGYDPSGRYPVVLTPGVGTIFGSVTLQVSRTPVWVLLGDLPAQRNVVSVRVRFEDGTSEQAATNGPYFSYVVSGGHAQPGRRPTAIQGLTDGGKVAVTEPLRPGTFDIRSVERTRAAEIRENTVDALVEMQEQGLPLHEIRGEDRVSTTPARLARMFGGGPGRYPPHPVVVVLRGPFTIATYLGGCRTAPGVCPAPVGRWAYFAYLIDPDDHPWGRMSAGAISSLRSAPVGAPYPDLSRLGRVVHDTPPRAHDTRRVMAAQARQSHRGALFVVVHRGSQSATTRTACTFPDGRYRPFDLCDGVARDVAFHHSPVTDQTQSAAGEWAVVAGRLGGWHGCLVITPATLQDLPKTIGTELLRGIWGTSPVWHRAGGAPTAKAACAS